MLTTALFQACSDRSRCQERVSGHKRICGKNFHEAHDDGPAWLPSVHCRCLSHAKSICSFSFAISFRDLEGTDLHRLALLLIMEARPGHHFFGHRSKKMPALSAGMMRELVPSKDKGAGRSSSPLECMLEVFLGSHLDSMSSKTKLNAPNLKAQSCHSDY